MMFILFCLLVACSFLWGWHSSRQPFGDGFDGVKFFFVGLCFWLAFFVYRYNYDFEVIAERKEVAAAREAAERREATPHVVREADGCKVYAFKSGERYHYFTRCKEMVTTDSSWEECTSSGKQRHCKIMNESITTSKGSTP